MLKRTFSMQMPLLSFATNQMVRMGPFELVKE